MKPFLLILLSIGLLWAKSSYGKFTSGTFVSGLDGTLGKIVDKNPHPWFKQFLNNVAIPNSRFFGTLVLWGEFLSAAAIIFGSLILLRNNTNKWARWILITGLVGGLFLNITFWLAFGYTSPSVDSLNLLMAVIEIIGIFVFMKQYA